MYTDIWAIGSSVLVSLAAVAGALKLSPATVIEKLLGHHLDRRMAELKRQNSAEIETLRSELAHLADRGVRSNEREYEALTNAWEKFVDAFYATRLCIGGFHEVPNFSNMSDDDVRRCLDSITLDADDKRRILNSGNRINRLRKNTRKMTVPHHPGRLKALISRVFAIGNPNSR